MNCHPDEFDLESWYPIFHCRWEIPIVALGLYGVLLGAKVQPSRRIASDRILFLWNAFLAVGSMLGFAVALPHLAHIARRSMHDAICAPPETFSCGYIGRVVWAFTLSKFVELGDTLWLKLRGRPIIFLHWYHHASVLLFCWMAVATRTGVLGLWFSTINMGVHSIMYAYYAAKTLPNVSKRLNDVAPFITTIQIAQMVAGASLVAAAACYELSGVGCSVSSRIACGGGVIYVTYGKLFYDFYKRVYHTTPSPKKHI